MQRPAMAYTNIRKKSEKLVPANRYWIGDNSTPNAGPRHSVTISNPFWIDTHPVTIGDLQSCILDGSFTPKRRSIDGFFSHILQTTDRLFNSKRLPRLLSTLPACGLLLCEANQICSFFGARLPNEVEWEIALNWNDRDSQSSGHHAPFVSKLGCECYAGKLQEWTNSAWTSRYWMGSSENQSNPVPENSPVSVRGCLPTANLASQYARIAADVEDDSVPRVFRRVWDHDSNTELSKE